MGTRRETIDLLLEYAEGAGLVSARRMFGEYALYCDGKVVALVFGDELYVKATAAGRAYLGEVAEAMPFEGAKPWFLISGDQWEDADWLAALLRQTAAELPLPKPKAKKTRKGT